MKLAVFDCDGTLVDSQADICAAMDRAFAETGLPAPDPRAVRNVVGLSLPYALLRLAPEADETTIQRLDAAYRTEFRAARTAGRLAEPLYAGMRELLDGLRAAGWALGVATGKSTRGLVHCLATHGLSDHFVTLQTADNHPSKPDPAMLLAALAEAEAEAHEAVMIGDTTFDMAMAEAAGVRAIGVSWGYHAPRDLIGAGAEAVARDMAELAVLLEESHG